MPSELTYLDHAATTPLRPEARVWRDMEEFDTSERAHANWPDRFFARLVDTYLATTANRGGFVGDAQCFVLDSGQLLTFALTVMKAVAGNPQAAATLVA